MSNISTEKFGSIVAGLIENLNPATNSWLSFLTAAPSLLQVIAFLLAWASCWLPLGIMCAIAINWQPLKPLATEQKLPLLASLYLIAPLVLWASNWVVDTSFSDYGFSWNLRLFNSLGLGFGLGVISLVILFRIQTALNWVTWQLPPDRRIISVLLPTFVLALWLSGIEELIFRGFIQTQLQQDYAPLLAAIISSLIFALLHLIWEQKETLPQLPGLWLMGMVLVLARYVNDGNLGLAWGMHTGWVWAIASLDSLQITYTGISSEWVTGKNGKILAGATGILFLLLTGGILWIINMIA